MPEINVPDRLFVCQSIQKAATVGDKMIIEILATPNSADTEGDIISPDMIDDSYFKQNGKITWRHTQGARYYECTPKHFIGTPIETRCSQEGYFCKAELYNNNEFAKAIWDDLNAGITNKYGASIEGSKIVNPYTRKIIKARVVNLAVDPNAIHPDTHLWMSKAVTDSIEQYLQGERFNNVIDILCEKMDKLEKSHNLECNHLDKDGNFIDPKQVYTHFVNCLNRPADEALKAQIIALTQLL